MNQETKGCSKPFKMAPKRKKRRRQERSMRRYEPGDQGRLKALQDGPKQDKTDKIE